MHAYRQESTQTNMNTYIHVCIYAGKHVCMSVSVHARMYVCVHVCMPGTMHFQNRIFHIVIPRSWMFSILFPPFLRFSPGVLISEEHKILSK